MAWTTTKAECQWCSKCHDPHGYGKIHTCPNCFMVGNFAEYWKED